MEKAALTAHPEAIGAFTNSYQYLTDHCVAVWFYEKNAGWVAL